MLRNYLTIALRNLRRHRGYTAINVTGLAVGIAVVLLIGLHVRDELSYDRQHPQVDRLYRVGNRLSTSGNERRVAITPAIYAEKLRAYFPQVEQYARLHPAPSDVRIQHGNRHFLEEANTVLYADAGFFDLFGFELQKGDPKTALRDPFSIVLTPSLAKKYFGTTAPLGQTLLVGDEQIYTVTGVLREAPRQSHLSFSALLSMASLREMSGQAGPGGMEVYGPDGTFFTNWHFAAGYTYLRLTREASADTVEARLPDFIAHHLPETFHDQYAPFLEPVKDIHLYSDVLYGRGDTGNIAYVYILSAIAVIVLLIACVNYVNLSTARAMHRAREVGVRKVLGAEHGQLIRQFLGESVLLTVVALGVAVLAAEMSLPAFNALTGKTTTLYDVLDPVVLAGLVAVVLLVGVGAGSYPALFLTNVGSAHILRGTHRVRAGHAVLRKGLVVFQFAVSIVLLVSTGVIYRQLDYVRSKDLGFEPENVIVVELPADLSRGRHRTFKETFRQHPGVINVSASAAVPGRGVPRHDVKPEGTPEDDQWLMTLYAVDHDFIETLGFDLAAGRAFSQALSTDSTTAYLLNETAVARLGWHDRALGREFTWLNPKKGPQKGRVVGVVNDFHYQPLREIIEPAVFSIAPEWYQVLSIRIRPDEVQSTLAALEDTWTRMAPEHPFQYTFLDETLENGYATEERFGLLVGVFTALAMLVTCLGLLGLALFSVARRVKEIGIRKVLGATVLQVLLLLTRDFFKLVVVGFTLACPAAYLAMTHWLNGFAYRTELSWWIFLLAGLIALAVALLTVSYQTVKAALADPVKSLRYE